MSDVAHKTYMFQYKSEKEQSILAKSPTYDPVQPEVEIVCDDAAQVSAKRVAHAGQPVGAESCVAEARQGFSGTPCHRPQVMHSRDVARRLTQCTPIQHEHVVTTSPEISWWTEE